MQLTTKISQDLIREIYNEIFKNGYTTKIEPKKKERKVRVTLEGRVKLKGGRIGLLSKPSRFRINEAQATFLPGTFLKLSLGELKIPGPCFKICVKADLWPPFKCRKWKEVCLKGRILRDLSIGIDLSILPNRLEISSDFVLDTERKSGPPDYWQIIGYPFPFDIDFTLFHGLEDVIVEEFKKEILKRVSGDSFAEAILNLFVKKFFSWKEFILYILDVGDDLQEWITSLILDEFGIEKLITNQFYIYHKKFAADLFKFPTVVEEEDDKDNPKELEDCDKSKPKHPLTLIKVPLENISIGVEGHDLMLGVDIKSS